MEPDYVVGQTYTTKGPLKTWTTEEAVEVGTTVFFQGEFGGTLRFMIEERQPLAGKIIRITAEDNSQDKIG